MNLFQKYLVSEFAEEYEDGQISRREALKLIASISGSLLIANSILAACSPPPTQPESKTVSTSTVEEATAVSTPSPQVEGVHGTVDPQDPAIVVSEVEFLSGEDLVQAYLTRPVEPGTYPIMLVCHENRGLTDHIRDVTRRFAKVGYAALAVDLLSRQGGTSALSSGEVPGALGTTEPDQFVQDFQAGLHYMQEQSFVQPTQVGMIGFCFGGGVTWRVATQMTELRAAAPFYGPHPGLEDVPGINAAVMAVYGGRDQRINQGIPAIETAMQENNKTYEKVIYPDADHAFFNDTGSRYNPEAAQDAWQKVLDWFDTYLN